MCENTDNSIPDLQAIEPALLFYSPVTGGTTIEVRLEGDSVWLNQEQMAVLYRTVRTNILKHIANIYDEGELEEAHTCREIEISRQEGARMVRRKVKLYNLDMVISVGYRVKSVIATRFRQWATARLTEYIIKGFTMDDARLKGQGGGNYWKELLDRIRDIRSSEKVLYRQVLDLYATSADYNANSEVSRKFFQTVQNKLHYAAHGHTAAEVIYQRADADKPFMGLTTFKGSLPILSEVTIAKNYLNQDELKILNNLVSGYFDFAEIRAMRRQPVYMQDYVAQLDSLLQSTGQQLLTGPGKISSKQAEHKAKREYRKFQEKTLSPVEVAYLETIRATQKKVVKQLRSVRAKDSENGRNDSPPCP